MTNNSPRPGYDTVDENGKPMAWNIARYERNYDLIAGDTRPQVLQRLKPEIDRIRTLFQEGNVEELLQITANTAPVAYELGEHSLGDAQVLNDFSGLALSCLIGEDYIRPLRYNYQSHLGQNSADVDLNRQFAAAGLLGDEEQKSALAEIRRKNPAADKILEGQQAAIRRILALREESKD